MVDHLEDRALDPAPVEREDAQGDEAHVANTLFVGFAVAVAPLALASKPEALKVFFRLHRACSSIMLRSVFGTKVAPALWYGSVTRRPSAC